jgi:hypothetical protein
VAVPLGTREWHVGRARGSGDQGLARWCPDGEGRHVVVRGDRRGGGWRRKGIEGVASCSTSVVGVGTGWWSRSGRGTLRVSAEVADTLNAKSAHGIKSVGLVHVPTLLS